MPPSTYTTLGITENSSGHFMPSTLLASFMSLEQNRRSFVCLGRYQITSTELDKPLVVQRVQSAFPDCTIRAGNDLIRVEFELYGSNFNHDENGCDMLVCWRDIRNNSAGRLPRRRTSGGRRRASNPISSK